MGEYRFGLLAAKNGRLVERMRGTGRNGRPGRVWPETEDKIREFIAAERLLRTASTGSNSPEALPSGGSGARFANIGCAPVAISDEAAR